MSVDKTLTVEAAAAMTPHQLSEILYESEKYHLEVLSESFEEAYEELKLKFEQNKDVLLDTAYLTLMDNGIQKAAKAGEYVALKTAYRAIEYIEEIKGEIKPVLTDEQLAKIAEAVNQNADEFIAGVKAYGEATEDAVEDYLERIYRNLSEAERDALEDVYEAAEDLIEEMEEAMETIASEELAEIRNALAPIAEYLSVEIDKIKDYDDLEDYVLDKIEDRIEEVEDWFDENLTKEEKQEIADAKKAMQDKIAELQSEFEQAVADLKDQVGKELKNRQQERERRAA